MADYKKQSRPSGSSKNEIKKDSDQKSKSMEDLANDVLDKEFGNNITNILNINSLENIDDTFKKIESFTEHYAKAVSPSQLRNIYSHIVKAEKLMELKMIRPNLAYIAARQQGKDKNKAKEFMAFIDYLIKETKEENVESFKKVMEAIVAYHKFYNDKQNKQEDETN